MQFDLATVPDPADLGSAAPDADLLLVLPGVEADRDALDAGLTDLVGGDAPVMGASVGALATHETDGFVRDGAAVLGFSGIDLSVDPVENAWSADIEDIRGRVRGEGTTLVTGVGARAPEEGPVSSTVRRLTSRLIKADVLGQRQRIIRNVTKMLQNSRQGYSPLFLALEDEIGRGTDFITYPSSDLGTFSDGFEIDGDRVTEQEAGVIARTDMSLSTGQARSALSNLSSDRVVERFDDIESEDRVIYRLDGKTVSDLREEHGILSDTNYDHHLIVEMEGTHKAVPFAIDLDVLITFTEISDDATAALVKAPRFGEYRDALDEMLDDLPVTGFPHLTFNPTRHLLYGDDLFGLADDVDGRLDEYLVTIDNGFRQRRAVDDMSFPSYVLY